MICTWTTTMSDWDILADYETLRHLQAAVEDTRQRDLTRSLGQVECRANVHAWEMQLIGRCHDCKAAL